MGSRIMHYCISSIIADKIKINDQSEFLLGGIAPDIHGLMGVRKGVTHFKDIDEAGESYINYVRFYETYKHAMNEPFYLGYLCHLISEDVWLDFYLKKNGEISSDQNNKILQTTYRDFRRLNGRMIELYSLQLHSHTIPSVKIEGYNANYLVKLLELLHEDFTIDHDLMNEPLELYSNDEIIDYIDKSVEKSIDFVAPLTAVNP
ncbi:hypothetical protein G4V62_02035 [Bacillaceae bacterium SIJ1]|uniref:hypothetical protein n=1 Tax=Litoribacterium kuwaitense TaxID=1398745 RepID=UPI0013EADB4E|nr:hypothetical protein [Litoribacterium kuwaitense]NGP43786.1 hypothetical protein [Litoribacterium kuwaitense]